MTGVWTGRSHCYSVAAVWLADFIVPVLTGKHSVGDGRGLFEDRTGCVLAPFQKSSSCGNRDLRSAADRVRKKGDCNTVQA